MKKTTKFFVSFVILLMLVMPAIASAKLVPDCGKYSRTIVDNTTTPPSTKVITVTECGYTEFMQLINGIITFALVDLAIPIAAIMFAYAGVLLVTSGGSTESRSKAKSIFGNAVKGLILAAAAWIIVKTLLSILGFDGSWIGL